MKRTSAPKWSRWLWRHLNRTWDCLIDRAYFQTRYWYFGMVEWLRPEPSKGKRRNYFIPQIEMLEVRWIPSSTVSFPSASVIGSEAARNAFITVNYSGPDDQTASVKYATANGTALAGVDFAAASGTLTFAPGVRSQTIRVGLTDEGAAFSPGKTFTIALRDPGHAALGSFSVAQVTIEKSSPVPSSISGPLLMSPPGGPNDPRWIWSVGGSWNSNDFIQTPTYPFGPAQVYTQTGTFNIQTPLNPLQCPDS